MAVAEEATTTNHNADLPSEAPQGSRDAHARADQPTTAGFMQRVRDRRGTPVKREDERPQAARKPLGRTPWREDLPSPWCVWQDYREGADHFGREAALAKGAYWLAAAPPLAVNKLAALLHIATQRPGRAWGAAFAVLLFVFVCWRLAS